MGKFVQTATFLTSIRKVLVLNIGRDTGHPVPNWGYR
jgi:hypothetical protein